MATVTQTRVNLATNPSFETASGTITVRTNLSPDPRFVVAAPPANNTHWTSTLATGVPVTPTGVTTAARSVKSGTATTQSQIGSWYNIDGQAASTAQRSIGAWLYASAAGYAGVLSMGSTSGPTVVLPAATWTWITLSGPATGAQAICEVYRTDGASANTTDFCYITGVTTLAGTTPPPQHFDGATTAAGDFTYAWTGAVNASTSLQQAPGVANVAGGNCAAVSSADWKLTGSKSLRLIPTTTSGDSFASIDGDTGGMRASLVAGKTYTISATCRLSVAQSGAGAGPPRAIVVFSRIGTAGYVSAFSASAPNAAGSTRLSVTYTIPVGATEAFVRLYNGASAGNGEVWWDDLLIEETSTLGTYFDGNTPSVEPPGYSPAATRSYSWSAGAHASTSLESLSVPLQDYQVELPDGTIAGANTTMGLLEILGLRGSGDTRNTDYDRSGVDGMSPGISLLTGRTVQVKWLVTDQFAAETALQNLTRNWQNTNNPASITMSARDYLVEVATAGNRKTSALKIQLPGRATPFTVFGKPGRLDPPVNSSYQHGWIEVGSEWQNLDGKVYDDEVHVAQTTLPSSSGGAPFPWAFPVNFGPSTGGTLFVENNGLYPAKPVYKITGPIINPRVIESSTGKFVRINLTLIAGDVLIVDTDSRVVRLNGVNRNNALDVNSSIFSIPPGGTSLAFSSTDAGGSTYGSLSVYTLNTYSAA